MRTTSRGTSARATVPAWQLSVRQRYTSIGALRQLDTALDQIDKPKHHGS